MSLQKRFADEIKRDAWRRLFIAAMLLAQWLREVARCIRGTFEHKFADSEYHFTQGKQKYEVIPLDFRGMSSITTKQWVHRGIEDLEIALTD